MAASQASFLNEGGNLNTGVYHVYSTAAKDQTNPIYEVPTSPALKLHGRPSFEADAEVNDIGVTDLRFSSKTLKRATVTVYDELTSDLAVITRTGESDPFPIIRNDELILLRAEANVGLGNYAEAEADMNIVRIAAGLAGYTGADASNALDRLLCPSRESR